MAEVQTIAVIGAGRVGRGIAQVAARGGFRTILEDLLPNALRRAESEIRSQLDWAVESGGVSADAANAALSRLEFAGSVEDAARQADLVIEAVPEELESKIEIFTLLDKICRPGTILASHISTLSITEISRVTYRARNCVGMHFAEPVESESDWRSSAARRPMMPRLRSRWKLEDAWAKKPWYCRTHGRDPRACHMAVNN